MRSTSPLRQVPSVVTAVAAVAAVALSASAVGPVAAGADPVADKRAEAARIAAALESQGQRVSVLAEELAQARLRAEEVAGQVRAAQERVRSTDRRVAQARARLRGHAVASYVKGDELPAVHAMLSGSTDELAVRSAYVREIAGRQQAALEDLRAARQDLDEHRSRLEEAQRSARAALASVESRQQAAEVAAAAQEATLGRVQGELGALVAAEAQRRSEEEARQAQAEMAVRDGPGPPPAGAPGGRRGGAAGIGPIATGPAPGPPASGAAAAVAEARRQIGKPYRWGAAGPDSFDCSGLTLWAWRAGGRSLPHSSRAQYAATSRVPLSAIQPGDLVFYGTPIHHMGIYVGGGTMVEASQTGTPVRYASIYRRDMVGVGRVS